MVKSKRLLTFGIALLVLLACLVVLGWAYTSAQLAAARARGVYSSAEGGMIAMLSHGYSSDADIKIFRARPDLHSGRQPYIWYVIAEVRASARADGSQLGYSGCDSGGSFFLQTKEGWVHIPEGAFPHFMGIWMDAFGMAGPGVPTPTTDLAPGQPKRFCQSS